MCHRFAPYEKIAYTPQKMSCFSLPHPDFYTVLHTETWFFTSFCIPRLNFCTILHTVTLVFTSFCIPRSDCCTFLHTATWFLHGFAYRDPIFYIILHTELEFLHDFAYRALFFYIFLHRPPCFFARFCIPLGFSEKIALTWCKNLPIFAQKFPKFNAKTAHRNNRINNSINNSVNDSSAHTREAAAQPRKQKRIF